jgi:hypothetical protein
LIVEICRMRVPRLLPSITRPPQVRTFVVPLPAEVMLTAAPLSVSATWKVFAVAPTTK